MAHVKTNRAPKVGVTAAGSLILLPSLYYLFRVFKGRLAPDSSALHEEGERYERHTPKLVKKAGKQRK